MTGQRGSDPSAYRFSIAGYYNILQGIKPETTQKTWILLSNAHITKYSTITVKLKIKHKSTMNMRRRYIYVLLTYALPVILNLYADGSLPLWPVGPSSFTDPTRRRVTSSLARRLTRHLLVRPPVLALWASGFGSSCLAPGPNSRNRRFSSDITAVVTN